MNAAVHGGAGSSPVVDIRRFKGLVTWFRHDEPVGKAMFRKKKHVAFTQWFVPSPTNSPCNWSNTARLREPPVLQTGLLNPSLLDFFSITVTFGLQLLVFVHDFPLERSFSLCFSLAMVLLFFFPVLHACGSCVPTKWDTARCHCQRKVNRGVATDKLTGVLRNT